MPNRIKVVIVIAIAMAAVLVKISLPAAQASTTACGSACISLSVQSMGTSDYLTESASSGNLSMTTAGTTNTGQDFTYEDYGALGGNLLASGVVSAKLQFAYTGDQLVEFQFAPGGATSDLCLADGVASGDANSEPPALTVTLAQCGLTAQTLWIVDGSGVNGYVDLISAGYSGNYAYTSINTGTYAGTGMFAEPAVLTVNSKNQVVLAYLSEIGGAVTAGQMWTGFSGA